MNFAYILYSAQLDSYYVGSTRGVMEERLRYHLGNHKGYTAKVKDWVVVYTQSHGTYKEAVKLERRIKKRGARRYLVDVGE